MGKIRTIETLCRELHEEDPNCALTKTALRRLVTTGAIPSRKVGAKFLVTREAVEKYLEGTV